MEDKGLLENDGIVEKDTEEDGLMVEWMFLVKGRLWFRLAVFNGLWVEKGFDGDCRDLLPTWIWLGLVWHLKFGHLGNDVFLKGRHFLTAFGFANIVIMLSLGKKRRLNCLKLEKFKTF